MIDIIIHPNDTCLARYVDEPIVSLRAKTKIGVVCGNCNLSFRTNRYMLETARYRYVANCPHCGKWNRMNLFGEDYRRIYERF
jgi:hypothetical protein